MQRIRAWFAGTKTLGAPGAIDVFVTTADDIAGISTSSGVAQRLTLVDEGGNLLKGPFAIIEFDTPLQGLSSPVLRTNPGFVQGGFSQGGAREFILPNLNVSELSGLTVRVLP